MADPGFFSDYGEWSRYHIDEIVGRGSYGVVCAATDMHTGERVAIKKIENIFEHVSDSTRILREIKLLRLLQHQDIVEVKRIMLPPSPREFNDIYVVFELMESDMHHVIEANDDLTHEHHQFFLYQLLRALKFIHSANVYHRDLKPKNILANSDCKLKICDFGLARVAFQDVPTTIFWTDYIATRWYRAPELCGSFFSKYTPAVDMWSLGCIFAEILTGQPLFPGKSVVHQLELITDILGSPSEEIIAKVKNEKARRYLQNMWYKPKQPLAPMFPKADPRAVALLERMLSFNPAFRPSAEEALEDEYFRGLGNPANEPTAQPLSRLEFDFERKRLTLEDVRSLIYHEILEYHPRALKDYQGGHVANYTSYPSSAVDQFKRSFLSMEENSANTKDDGNKIPDKCDGLPHRESSFEVIGPSELANDPMQETVGVTPLQRQHNSLPREQFGGFYVELDKFHTDAVAGQRGGEEDADGDGGGGYGAHMEDVQHIHEEEGAAVGGRLVRSAAVLGELESTMGGTSSNGRLMMPEEGDIEEEQQAADMAMVQTINHHYSSVSNISSSSSSSNFGSMSSESGSDWRISSSSTAQSIGPGVNGSIYSFQSEARLGGATAAAGPGCPSCPSSALTLKPHKDRTPRGAAGSGVEEEQGQKKPSWMQLIELLGDGDALEF